MSSTNTQSEDESYFSDEDTVGEYVEGGAKSNKKSVTSAPKVKISKKKVSVGMPSAKLKAAASVNPIADNGSSELMNAKKRAVESLLERAKDIYSRFIYIWANSRHDITFPLNEAINDISLAIQSFTSSFQAPAFAIGALIGTCDERFDEIIKIIAKFNIGTKTEVSFTYLAETQTVVDSFIQYHIRYANDNISSQIYLWLIPRLVSIAPVDVEAEYKRNPRATALYAQYIQHMLDARTENECDVIELLERAKTSALRESMPSSYSEPPASTREIWPLQRFGLVPRAQRLTPTQLIAFYFKHGQKNASIDDFVAVARTKGVNVLLMRFINQNPVEYDISRLIDENAAHKYMASESAGVSKTTIERFQTIRQYESLIQDDKKSSIEHKVVPVDSRAREFNLHEYRHATSRHWIVARTIDNINWDPMANCAKNCDAANPDMVNFALVEKIIRGPSPRIDAYNNLKNESFRTKLRPIPDFVDTVKAENKQLITTLINRIAGRIIQYVDKSLIPLPTSPAKLEEAISDPMFANIMREELLKSYSECGISADAPADEFAISFISDIDNKIIVQFTRNLKVGISTIGSNTKIFKEYSGETLKTRLYNLFVDIIKRSVAAAMQTKDNIYEKILLKDAALRAMDKLLKQDTQ